MKHIEVSAAVMIREKKVFAAQRKAGGELALSWEFPGGKLESGEGPEDAIVREIAEELSISIKVERKLLVVEHQYATFFLTMYAFLCEIIEGEPILNEHKDGCWLEKSKLYSVQWSEADLPIVKVVEKCYKRNDCLSPRLDESLLSYDGIYRDFQNTVPSVVQVSFQHGELPQFRSIWI